MQRAIGGAIKADYGGAQTQEADILANPTLNFLREKMQDT